MSNKEVKGNQMVFVLDENFTVTQHNQLITSKHEMSAMEQKMVLVLISTIKKEDTKLEPKTFRVKDLAKLMKVSEELLYRDLDKVCDKLLSRVITIKNGENKKDWMKFNIASTAIYNHGLGSITLKLNDDASPFLLQLKELFLAHKLKEILYLNSKYSIRLYQLTKSNSYKNKFTVTLDKFKDMLSLEQKSYDQFSNIKLKVLTPAMDEINSKTDIKVDYKPIKTGRKVTELEFIVSEKKKKGIYLEESLTKSNSYNYTSNNSKRIKKVEKESLNRDYDPLERQLLGWDLGEAAISIED